MMAGMLRKDPNCHQKRGWRYMNFWCNCIWSRQNISQTESIPIKGLDKGWKNWIEGYLPHGSINDYFVQFLSLNPGLGVSRKLFSSEPWHQLALFCSYTLCLLYISNYYELHLFSPRCGCRILKIVYVSDSFPTTHAAHNVSDTGWSWRSWATAPQLAGPKRPVCTNTYSDNTATVKSIGIVELKAD